MGIEVARIAEVQPRATLSSVFAATANTWGILQMNSKVMDSSGFVIVNGTGTAVHDFTSRVAIPSPYRFGLPAGSYLFVVTNPNGTNGAGGADTRIMFRLVDADTSVIYAQTPTAFADTNELGKQSGAQTMLAAFITGGTKNIYLQGLCTDAGLQFDDVFIEPASGHDPWSLPAKVESSRCYISLDIYKLK